MTPQAPPTPPMSEKDVLGGASSVSNISNLAARVSVRLFALSRNTKDATHPIETLSKDIASTGAVLSQLGHQLKKSHDVSVGSPTLVTSVDDLVEECKDVFDSIDKALDDNNTGNKTILGLKHYVHFASLEPQFVLLQTNLERLKTPLALMLNVLIYAAQLKSDESTAVLRDQQELIKVLNEERKRNERRFHQLTREIKVASEDASAYRIPRDELPSNPETPNREAKDEGSRVRARVWIKEESPDRRNRPTQNGSTALQGAPAAGPVPGKVRGRVRKQYRPRVERDDNDATALLDMASFLRSTGPDTPRHSDEDTFGRPAKPHRSRSRYEARDPIVRGDSSDLINFFREGSPLVLKNGVVRTPRSTTPVRHASDPMTPPHTGRDDNEKMPPLPSLPRWEGPEEKSALPPPPQREMTATRRPIPPLISPMQTHLRSQSAGFPSPLGSHPPEPQIDTSRPATTKWPLQAVVAWLDKNSFSVEWQDTFKVLQIEGSEFVGLESGQSIRKMLTVIYPQLAKECSESGKGWDQARERTEGQRLRKLIRELPVDIKYEDGPLTMPERETSSQRPASRSPNKADILSGGRPRAVTSPSEPTTPRSKSMQVPAQTESKRTGILPLLEAEEEPSDIFTAPSVRKSDDPPRGRGVSETSDVPDEWVRKWTVLSPTEIARGREVASMRHALPLHEMTDPLTASFPRAAEETGRN